MELIDIDSVSDSVLGPVVLFCLNLLACSLILYCPPHPNTPHSHTHAHATVIFNPIIEVLIDWE